MGIATADGILNEPVRRFCASHHLTEPLQTALRLVETVFAPIRHLRVDLETDPETDDPTVVIEVAVIMGVDEAVARKREYTRLWLQQSSPAVREKVRLVYDLVPG